MTWSSWSAIRLRTAAALLALAFVSIGCSGDDEIDQLVDSSLGSTSDATDSDPPAGPSTTQGASATSTASTSASATSTSPTTAGGSTTLPGEPFVGFAAEGDEMMVVGVAHDDVLNVRAGPGAQFELSALLGPTDTDAVAMGRARLLSSSIWYEISADGVTGWANSRYLAFEGGVDDVTAEIVASLGERPQAETMVELGTIVADERASDDVASRIVLTVAPTVGDLGEITYDVIGLADDSLYGVRLHVFGQPTDSGDGFSLGSVEQTLLCGRGAVSEGLCV